MLTFGLHLSDYCSALPSLNMIEIISVQLTSQQPEDLLVFPFSTCQSLVLSFASRNGTTRGQGIKWNFNYCCNAVKIKVQIKLSKCATATKFRIQKTIDGIKSHNIPLTYISSNFLLKYKAFTVHRALAPNDHVFWKVQV